MNITKKKILEAYYIVVLGVKYFICENGMQAVIQRNYEHMQKQEKQ